MKLFVYFTQDEKSHHWNKHWKPQKVEASIFHLGYSSKWNPEKVYKQYITNKNANVIDIIDKRKDIETESE